MKKYEVKTDSFQFRMGSGSIPAMSADEIYATYVSCDPRITSNYLSPNTECAFDTLAEAKATFDKNFSGYGRTEIVKGSAGYLLTGRMAWIEEAEYDELGDFVQGGDVWKIDAETLTPDVDNED